MSVLGDRAAFDALVGPHWRALHLHCYRMLGSIDQADDALQEALLRAWRGLGGFEGRAPLHHWLHRVATMAVPSPELAAFLEAGQAPVYIGFGSMAGNDPERIGRIVMEAVRLAAVRAVVASGWGGLRVRDLPDEVFQLDQAPHDWLFPRMAAIVHHGGSGTTGAALAAGRPQVVCPFVADQPFWAARVHAAGVAPPPQPQRRLTAEGLAAAIRAALSDAAMTRAAARLGHAVRGGDGNSRAVKILESLS
ncbi:nucleotide disphospho-sugar-binding domain-containing protein [Nonomuraea sp. NPDC049709]|uniref:glycosyltransferase n=1 Tax=Nonomuraea sp. NPDC049709 TaxID=3154736 RepID=UPI00343C6F64